MFTACFSGSLIPCLISSTVLISATLLVFHMFDRLYDVDIPLEDTELFDDLPLPTVSPSATQPSALSDPTSADRAQANAEKMRRIYAGLLGDKVLFGDVLEREDAEHRRQRDQ